MKRIAGEDGRGVVVVPVVVQPVVVGVPPVTVPVEVADEEVVVLRVAKMYKAPSVPLLAEGIADR